MRAGRKKVTVKYLEKESKKEGMQSFCRVIFNRRSTMFKVGIASDPKAEEWVRDKSEIIQGIVKAEALASDSDYEVKGIRERLIAYSETVVQYISFLYFDIILMLHLKSVLLAADHEDLFVYNWVDHADHQRVVKIAFRLLATDYGEQANQKILEFLERDGIANLICFELFSLKRLEEGKPLYYCHHLLTSFEEIEREFSDFVNGLPDTLPTNFEPGEESYSTKLTFVAKYISIEKVKERDLVAWLKRETLKMTTDCKEYAQETYYDREFDLDWVLAG